jgi:branched-chain amino acid transport system ATP-binding protein
MMLEVEDISSGYGEHDVLTGVSARMREGEITCLIGLNGAGKSTLIRTIAGLVSPSRGKILLDGEEISGLPVDAILRKGISTVLQERSCFLRMSVLENLELAAYTVKREEKTATLAEIYNVFPILKERKSQAAGTLSGGERRMLELARALMVNPRYILVDEPSLGLSPGYLDLIYEKLRELKTSGKCILLAEQDLRKVDVADYFYFIEAGQVKDEGDISLLSEKDALRRFFFS